MWGQLLSHKSYIGSQLNSIESRWQRCSLDSICFKAFYIRYVLALRHTRLNTHLIPFEDSMDSGLTMRVGKPYLSQAMLGLAFIAQCLLLWDRNADNYMTTQKINNRFKHWIKAISLKQKIHWIRKFLPQYHKFSSNSVSKSISHKWTTLSVLNQVKQVKPQ